MLYQEREHQQRIKFLREIRNLDQQTRRNKLAYIDESGFERDASCRYGYSKKGQKIKGEKEGKRRKRENLIAARQGGKLIAPLIVTGSINAICVEIWLEQCLLPVLEPESILIGDNAPIHRKNRIREIVEPYGHQVLFLPKYSPDFNKIEHDFSALKKRREYAEEGTPLDEIVNDYCDDLLSRSYSN